jgi:hypothetical protein
VLQARVLDLIESGRLDDTKVGIWVPANVPDAPRLDEHLAALLQARSINIVFDETAPPDPVGGSALDLSAAVGRLERSGAKALITAGLDPSFLDLARAHTNLLSIYDLTDSSEDSLDSLRQSGGAVMAKYLNDTGVYMWSAVSEQDFRISQPTGQFTAMCNQAYRTYRRPALAADNLPVPTSSVARICLAMRIAARALFSAGPNLTQRSVMRALYTLPYIEDASGDAPKPRPNQVINEPVTKVQRVVVLDKAEYPCRHPSIPKDVASYQMCLVPVQGWDDGGHAVNGPLWTN